MNSQKTECTLYLSYDVSVWLRPWKGQYSLAAAMKGLGIEVGNKEYSLQPFLKCHAFTCLSFGQKTQISEGCNKDVKLTSGEPNDFIASNIYRSRECENMPNVKNRNDFIMQK
jgi:hypothetical protein